MYLMILDQDNPLLLGKTALAYIMHGVLAVQTSQQTMLIVARI